MSQMQQTQATLFLNTPDCHFNFDNVLTLYSTTPEYENERANFFHDVIFPYWQKTRCSAHQLAQALKQQFNIELWRKTPTSQECADDVYFIIRFIDQMPGDLLVYSKIA